MGRRQLKEAAMEPVEVLYIAGSGRSGSTLIDNVLGQLPGHFSAGEVTYFWSRSILEGRQCGCGRPSAECEIWSRVIDRLSPLQASDAREMVAAARRGTRVRHIPLMMSSRGLEVLHRRLGNAYLERLQALYLAIRDVTGASVIVDSSKFPGYGYMVGSLPLVNVKALHVVRDPRAVAYSWLRLKEQPDSAALTHMMTRRPATVAPRWVLANLASERLWRRRQGQYALMRYEDFVEQPRVTLEGALKELGYDGLPDGLVHDRAVELGPNHTVSGNPSRFQTGTVSLKLDDEWSRSMAPSDRFVAAAGASPLMGHYGYRWRR
jgi:hypothetical protein